MIRPRVNLALCGFLFLLNGCAVHHPGMAVGPVAGAGLSEMDGPVSPLAFSSIQPDEFSEAGALSNAWADFDGDGELDFAVSLKGGAIRLYRQEKGVFTSVGESLGLPVSGPEYRGLSWGDFDGDGYPDLFAGASSREAASAVFRNLSGQGFSDIALSQGLAITGRAARQSNWVDFDNDGDLDLYAADRVGRNRLLRNDSGVFSELPSPAAPDDARPTVGACWVDYDRDGFLDLFLANQSGAQDALWRNTNPGFEDIAGQAGIDTSGRTPAEGGVGCAIGDFDNDGLFDVYFINYGANRLYRNRGDATFEDVTVSSGTSEPEHAVGADWGDFNNDGFQDLFVTGYEGPSGAQIPVNYLYLNNTDGSFTNILDRSDPLNAADHGVIWIDYDLDGLLDLSVTDGYGPDGGYFLFRNQMRLSGEGLNIIVRNARGSVVPGAEIRLYTVAGEILGSRLMHTGGGYNAQSAAPVHFGIGRPGPVRVEVTFLSPEGRRSYQTEPVDPADWAGRVLELNVP